MDHQGTNNKAGMGLILLTTCLALLFMRAQAAGVEVDGTTNTTLDTAPNGVSIVNIANPNAKGLSHNTYRRFNVDNRGLILNNANQSVVNTELGGQIFGNAQLGAPAKVILNEVTSTHRSVLNGYTEVAGQAADVVLANPNGISINGAGFINAPRVTLTTGIPNIELSGDLGGFSISAGEISIEGEGLNTEYQTATSIYSYYLQLNAKLHAQDLDLALGSNQVNYAGRNIESSTQGAPAELLLDSSVLGGMYANKISLVGTGQGLGMNLPPEVIASSGDIQISNDGRIVLQQLDAGGNTSVSSGSRIDSSDTVYGQGKVTLEALDTVVIDQGLVAAGSELSINTGRFENHASVIAGLNDDLSLSDAGNLTIQSSDLLNTGELFSTDTMTVHADSIDNRGLINASSNLTVNANRLVNQTTLFSGSNMQLYARDELENQPDASILSINNLILAAVGDGAKTTQITNNLGLIQTINGDIDIFAVQFDNIGAAEIQYEKYFYDLGNSREAETLRDAKTLNLAYSSGYTKHNSTARARWVNEVLRRLRLQAPDLYAANASAISGRRNARFLAIEERIEDLSITTPAYLDSGNDLNLQVGTFTNRDSVVAASNDINLEIGNNYFNDVTSESVSVTDHQYYTRAKHNTSTFGNDNYTSVDRSGYIAINTTRSVNSNTVTQAGGSINWTTDGVVVNSGNSLALGNHESAPGVDPSQYGNIDLPTNDFGLYVTSTSPDSSYLVETNPRFTELDNFIGSDYLLERLDFSAEDSQKRLGDAYFESSLIRDSVFEQSGKRYLDASISNDNEQFQFLMENALAAQQELELIPGVALSADQVKRLNQSIVWLETQQIDGQEVLVPQVYFVGSGDSQLKGGQIIAGGDINLQAGELHNSGSIAAGSNLAIEAQGSILNQGGELAATNSLTMSVNENIENVSGHIRGTDVELTSIDGDIINRREISEYSISDQDIEFTTTLVGEAAQIEAVNSMELNASGEIRVEGSTLNASEMRLEADSVNIVTTQRDETYYAGDSDNFVHEETTQHLTSSLGGGNIVIAGNSSVHLNAAQIDASSELRIEAGEIEIGAAHDRDYYSSKSTRTGTLSETVATEKSIRIENVASELNAETVVIVSDQGNIDITGSNIHATGHIAIDSAADIRIEAGYDGSLDESYKHKTGWFSGGNIYTETEDLEGRVTETAVKSGISAQSLELSAASDIELHGVDIVLEESLQASAQSISLQNAESVETEYSKHTEISIGFDDLVSNFSDIDDLITHEDGELTLTLLEASYEHAEEVITRTTAVLSQVEAGSISFNAANDEATGGDITIVGSELYAEDSITLEALGDVAILDAKHTETSEGYDPGGDCGAESDCEK